MINYCCKLLLLLPNVTGPDICVIAGKRGTEKRGTGKKGHRKKRDTEKRDTGKRGHKKRGTEKRGTEKRGTGKKGHRKKGHSKKGHRKKGAQSFWKMEKKGQSNYKTNIIDTNQFLLRNTKQNTILNNYYGLHFTIKSPFK